MSLCDDARSVIRDMVRQGIDTQEIFTEVQGMFNIPPDDVHDLLCSEVRSIQEQQIIESHDRLVIEAMEGAR